MPELPEVETVLRQILPAVAGRTITSLEIKDPRNIKGTSSKKFQRQLKGDKVLDLQRRAKYLIFQLKSGRYLVMHLGMTGRLLFKPDKYVKVAFHFSGGKTIYFSDFRLFGKLWLYPKCPDLKLGPEPLDPKFTLQKFKELFKSKRGVVKIVLMDQSFIAGIGNLYAAEALFEAGIHPKRKAESLTDRELAVLYRAVRKVLLAGITHHGSSVDNFVTAEGEEGKHQNYLKVYGRQGKPCCRCRAKIQKISLGQRGTYFCPKCQT